MHDSQLAPLHVEVADRQRHLAVQPEAICQLVRHVLRAEGVCTACLSVAILGDREMRDLHRRYLGIDGPTDVLSFPLSEDGDPLEGEVVVNAQQAVRVAKQLGSSRKEELFLYIVHGVLHLCGYDDRSEADAALMQRRQAALLDDWERTSDPVPLPSSDESPRTLAGEG